MNEWGVFGVIVALIGFVVAVITPVIKLNTIITKLSATVDNLIKSVDKISNDLDKLTSRNADSHERIFSKLDETGKTLTDHENRIKNLEKEIEQ